MEDKARIKVRPELKKRLEEIKGERTWSEFFIALINSAELAEELNSLKVIDIPDSVELQEEIIRAIEEARPPPEWRLLLPYFLVGLLAGIGLGLYLSLG